MQTEDLVVLHSIHEHHSNLLPWKKCAVASFIVQEDASGGIDIGHLEQVLVEVRQKFPNNRPLAAFTACSNLTGIEMDVVGISTLLRR